MNQFDRMYALAREIDQNTARLTEAHERARRETIREPIEGQLGSVAVNGNGLVSVDLDPRALRRTNGATLGPAVRRAITAAEATFRTRYLQHVAGAQPRLLD